LLNKAFTVTDFLRNHKEFIALVTETKKPVVLTVRGQPALVIQDPESYQVLMERLEKAEAG
jgi:prevent-host-death family protein